MCWAILIAAGPCLPLEMMSDYPISKPNVRRSEDTHAIKCIYDPDNCQDYAEYLKGGAAHEGKLGSDEVDKSQDQTND